MKIALTGHRPERLRGYEKEVREWVQKVLTELQAEEPVTAAYCGMARGADQIFGLECIEQGIPLCCCFPFERKQLSPQEQYLVDNSAMSMALQSSYSRTAYYERDCYMVDKCDVLLAIWDGYKLGGTWLTVDYALKQDKKIIYFPKEILWQEEAQLEK